MEAVREEETYKTYTADSLHFILKQLGVGIKKYSELKNPAPGDNRDPDNGCVHACRDIDPGFQ